MANPARKNTRKSNREYRNKYTAIPLPELTPEAFNKLHKELGSIIKIAKHFSVSETRMYQLARRLFPARSFRPGPPQKFFVEHKEKTNQVDVYTLTDNDKPNDLPVTVLWNGEVATCQLCVSIKRPHGSSSCKHARSLRRIAMEARVGSIIAMKEVHCHHHHNVLLTLRSSQDHIVYVDPCPLCLSRATSNANNVIEMIRDPLGRAQIG